MRKMRGMRMPIMAAAFMALATGCGDGLSGWLGAEPATGPTITVRPADRVVFEGQTATFSVTATGAAPLTYQWKKNGVNVTGGTGGTTASYTTPTTVLADSGAEFVCVVTDAGGNTMSNAATLTVNPMTITVMAPNGGETWSATTQASVNWSSQGSVGNVKIEMSTNGGGTWTTLVGSTANDGTENVTVPNAPSTQCRIRVAEIDGSPADSSNSNFSIVVPPTVTVLTPNGGETWTVGNSAAVTWNSTGGVGNVKIELSVNGGGAWSFLATSTPNDGSESVTVPDSPSIQCLVRVGELDDDPVDMSDGLFSIEPDVTVSVVSPNGGELWRIGTSQSITWTSALLANVKIELSRDGNWNNGDSSDVELIVASTLATAGSYPWTVAGDVSDICLFRVSDAVDGDPSDTSNASFEIGPRVWHVDALASAGGDGKSWNTAFQTIQDAVAASNTTGDEVWVKGGTYSGTITLKANMKLYGGFSGVETTSQRDWASNTTTTSGGSSYTIVGANDALVDGFTIANAVNISLNGCAVTSAASNLVIRNCAFNSNQSDDGGAIYLSGGTALVEGCSFSNNDADDDGGAVFVGSSATGTFTSCTFISNHATGDAEGLGGAICSFGTLIIDGCNFETNEAYGWSGEAGNGGAIHLDRDSASIRNSRFYWNDAENRGGAIDIRADGNGPYDIINCSIVNNVASEYGSGIAVGYADFSSCPVNIIHCSFSANEASGSSIGGGIYNYAGGELTIRSSILVNNYDTSGPTQIVNADTSLSSITYSCIEGGNSVSGNINYDRGDVDFVDNNSNLRLRSSSVCIDKATASGAPDHDRDGAPRPSGSGYDMGAYEYQF